MKALEVGDKFEYPVYWNGKSQGVAEWEVVQIIPAHSLRNMTDHDEAICKNLTWGGPFERYKVSTIEPLIC